jgi:outer membrane receptor protein involved in Fe transport
VRQFLCACIVLAWLVATAAAAAEPAQSLSGEIPAQPLSGALRAFSDQTQLQVVYVSELVAGLKSRRARAGLPPPQALRRLLTDTGLKFEFLNPRTVRIYAPHAAADHDANHAHDMDAPCCIEELEPVIVTGRFRGESVDKIPVDVTVWTREQMDAAGVKGIADIAALTPTIQFGFFSSVGGGIYTNLATRGVTDRHGVVTGAWFNDIPLPPAGSNTFARVFPFHFDLDRIEVLQGPQPVLLGANTQGGAVKFVTTSPSLTSFSGLTTAEWAVTERGDPAYELGAAVGGVLQPEKLGLRVSGWYRSEGGYVDRVDPFTGAVVDRNANGATSKSVRAALAFAPSETVLITPSLNYASTASHDSSAFMTYLSDPGAGRLSNGSLRSQPFEDSFYLATLNAQAQFDQVRLDSVTGYFDRSATATIDDTETLRWGGFGNPLGPAYPASYADAITTDAALEQQSFTQELQLSSNIEADQRLSWVLGGFFSRTTSRESDHVVASRTPVTGPLRGSPRDATDTTTRLQDRLAGFGQVKWRIDSHLALTAGLRVEYDRYDADTVAPPVFHAQHSETITAPSVALSYDAGARGMYYLSAAKGYSPGGVDAARPTCFERPVVYPTDTLWSYEFGAKRYFLDDRVHMDFSLFDIQWDNGAVMRSTCLFRTLPGKARSDGFSLNMQALLGKGFKAKVDVSYVNARYTQSFSNDGSVTVLDGNLVIPGDGSKTIVSAGDALGMPPLITSPWNAVASLGKSFALNDGRVIDLRVEDVFHSSNPGPFYTQDPAALYYAPGLQSDPSTNVLNLRSVLKLADVDLTLFVDNIFDSQPTLLKKNKGNDVSTLYYATTFRPRTVGLSGTWRF